MLPIEEREVVFEALQRYTDEHKWMYNVHAIHQLVTACSIRKLKLADENDFLSLIMLSSPHTREIAPESEPRSVRDVVKRMVEMDLTLEGLNAIAPMINAYPYGNWYKKCVKLLDYGTATPGVPFVLRPAYPNEMKETPGSTSYLVDGNHRALTYGWKHIVMGEPIPDIVCYMINEKKSGQGEHKEA